MEEQGIDPCAFCMQSRRSTIWATPPQMQTKNGCSMRGSNPRLLAHKTNTLPTELMELVPKIKTKKTKIGFNTTLFPGGPPPQYWAGSNRVNFGVRMRTGALRLIWSNPKKIQASVAEWLRRQTQVLVNFVGVSSILTGCTFCFVCFAGALSRKTKGTC
jgi:hypothetical protein